MSSFETALMATPLLSYKSIVVSVAASVTTTSFPLTPSPTLVAVPQIDGFSIEIGRTVGRGLETITLLDIFRFRPPQKWDDWRLLVLSALGSFAALPVLFFASLLLGEYLTLRLALAALLIVAGIIVSYRPSRDGKGAR